MLKLRYLMTFFCLMFLAATSIGVSALIVHVPTSVAAISVTSTPAQVQPTVIEPTPGEWFSEEVTFQTGNETALAGAEGSLRIDFTVAEDKRSIIGITTLHFNLEEEFALGGAWATTIEDGSFSQITKLPLGNYFFLIIWNGAFISPTEVEGTATIGIAFQVLASELEWSATTDMISSSDTTIISEQALQSIVVGEWVSDDVEFEISDERFAGQSGLFTLDFTVPEDQQRVHGTASLSLAGLVGAGSWNSEVLGEFLSSQITSMLDPNTAIYASWAGTFTAPDKIEGIAVIGLSPMFFEIIEWMAIPVEE